ncbi:MAG TPA: M28 family peptidase [Desulfosporosinus sp.]
MKFSKTIVIILVGTLSLLTMLAHFTTKVSAAPVINDSILEFSAEKAYEHVRYLTQKIGPRPAGSKSELKAAQYISYVLNQNGWKVREQPFSKVVAREISVLQREQQVELINSQNIIAELPGTLPDTIVAGAHYDSANLNAPGAMDNASGVGVLLELARVLSKEPHQETYQLIFFGAEEHGLVGSQFYAAQADLSAVRWMLNVDMVGIPIEIDVAGKKSAPPELIKQVTTIASASHIPFHLSRDFITMTRESPLGGVSDFSSFLDQGIPALGIGISGRPAGYFHRPEDRLGRVSLDAMQKIGDFTHLLLKTVTVGKLGPNVWDDLYLPFQMGQNVFILSSLEIRSFTFFTFLFTGWVLIRFYKRTVKHTVTWKKVLVILGITLTFSLLLVCLSGIGELLWIWIKQIQLVWYAYPSLFLGARIGISIGFFIILASWFYRLPLAREPDAYWLTGVILLLGASFVLTLIRVDIAFPFVFWLLCMDLQFFVPSFFLVLVSPYFIYRLHVELLNSQQWVSFYQMFHQHFIIFLGIYSLLLLPFFLAALHVALRTTQFWRKLLYRSRKPALVVVSLLILSLGLVPSFTRDYPQTVTVREEWSNSNGLVHIFSNEDLPSQLVKDLNRQGGKSIYVPTLKEKPPITVEASVSERKNSSKRTLDVSLKLSYTNEPYLIRLKFESDLPFIVQTDEFIPIAKLPKKLQLKGLEQPSGNYSLILQRTPPQRNLIQLSVETEGVMTCLLEGTFPDPSPQMQIKNDCLSVDHEIWFKESYEF